MATKCPQCHSDNPETVKFCGECGTELPSSKDVHPAPTETLQAPTKELTTGSAFAGRYQVIEELGKGGMGRVYKVFDTKIKEKVALKLIKPEIALDKETIERFNNELRLTRKVRHKNVCGMFDLGEAEGAHFITMEYVSGEDLKTMIRMTGSLTIGATLSIGKQVCDGLAEAHSLGIVHRDLKPQNIMIDKGGNAKIMDFGIARSIREKGITGPSVLIGTPEYMSPEQAEAREVDNRSDIYSLGIILYEMATGRVPFEGETALSVAMKHKGEIPKPPKQLNPNIPEDLNGVILRCLEKDRGRRYQAAADVRAELDRIEKGIPTAERVIPERKTITSREITVKFSPRKLVLPGLAVIAIAAAAVVFWPKKTSDLDPRRVAVAIFENQTGDPKHDPVGRLAAESIAQGLSQMSDITVAPLTVDEASASGKTEKDRLRLIAEETKAGKIVTGTYYLQGDTMTFHAKVMDIAGGKILIDLEPSSGPLLDPAKGIEPLRLKLMGGLAYIFNPVWMDFSDFMGVAPTYESSREYVDGCKAYFRADFSKAIDHFLLAAKLDPNFKMPLLFAAVTYYYSNQDPKAAEIAAEFEKSREALSSAQRTWLDWLQSMLKGDLPAELREARKMGDRSTQMKFVHAMAAVNNNLPREAVQCLAQLDPTGETWGTSTWYWTWLTQAWHMIGDHNQERKEAKRARTQFPQSLLILSLESDAAAAMGKSKELQSLIEESKILPPSSSYSPGSIMYSAAYELRGHGFKEEALQIFNQALQWYEGRPQEEKAAAGQRYTRARILVYLGRWDEAKSLFEGLHKEIPDNINYLGYLGAIAAHTRNREEAQRISEDLAANKTPFLYGSPTYWRARIAAVLGDKEGAVNLLHSAVREGYVVDNLDHTIDFDSLLDFPPYQELIRPKG